MLTDPATGANADGVYWHYETFLERRKGRLGALLGTNGAIYAIRRELFVPIPPKTIIDDFVIPLLAKLKHGAAIVYDSGAIGTRGNCTQRQRQNFTAGPHRRGGIPGHRPALAVIGTRAAAGSRWRSSRTSCCAGAARSSCCAAIASGLLSRHVFYCLTLLIQASFYAISLAANLADAVAPLAARRPVVHGNERGAVWLGSGGGAAVLKGQPGNRPASGRTSQGGLTMFITGEKLQHADSLRRSNNVYSSCKMTAEWLVSLLAPSVLAPFLAAAALLVKVSSGGPAFYCQVRLGRNGRPYRVYKIRTMVHQAEAKTGTGAAQDDPRVTPIGRFLRDTHLDELPQLLNILRGEMSLIGPRPSAPRSPRSSNPSCPTTASG